MVTGISGKRARVQWPACAMDVLLSVRMRNAAVRALTCPATRGAADERSGRTLLSGVLTALKRGENRGVLSLNYTSNQDDPSAGATAYVNCDRVIS